VTPIAFVCVALASRAGNHNNTYPLLLKPFPTRTSESLLPEDMRYNTSVSTNCDCFLLPGDFLFKFAASHS